MTLNNFNEWLVKNGHVDDISEIASELSASELDRLYEKWEDQGGGYSA